MKNFLVTALILFSGFTLFSQELLETEEISANCNTDFWTIGANGVIRQWSLDNGDISGGDTILSGGGNSLAYCGNSSSPTFYSNNYNPVGIIYYDEDSGWIQIPTFEAIDHNGGHLNDQYYRVEGAVIQIIKYWDGDSLITVDSLNGEFFAGVSDIGVDTLGQAWVFMGRGPSIVDSLKVYNKNGKIRSYSIQFNQTAYGAFFLNDTLYLGTIQDSIFPVIINGNSAQLGNPIHFPAHNFTDMASCQRTESTNSISPYQKRDIKVYPNPTHGPLSLDLDMTKSSLFIYNAQGQLLNLDYSDNVLDLTEQPSGIYYIKVNNKHWTGFHKIMKL